MRAAAKPWAPSAESAVAASLVIFLSVFLRIAFWHNLIRMLFTVWMIAQLTLVAVAVIALPFATETGRLAEKVTFPELSVVATR